ncbi:MAG: hypothetical protein O9282_08500 [Flavobacterium sp.]|jgi:hypothetical protein|uniref:hypothetical protein n=1 Tax=Flavobacterium sp. TaxID=239 RepID=UPI0022CC5B55|nr:hypothetical protein [Flavobacterium sp.]MCZ8331338.1 hypothetical protein [Flavobacterium sp.]
MKKISLKDVKNSLKRDEMRVIVGGCGSGKKCGACSSAYDCDSSCNICSGGKSGQGNTCGS